MTLGEPDTGRSGAGRLLLGYGAHILAHAGTDHFDFAPDQQLRRCAGLFERQPRLTDPVAFLRRLQHKGIYRVGRARALLARLCDGLSAWLGWDVRAHLEGAGRFERRWRATPTARRAPAIVALDIARHLFDAAKTFDPLQETGVVLLADVGAWCPAERQGDFFRWLDGWFPNLQFVVALTPAARRLFPDQLRSQVLPIPAPEARPAARPPWRLPPKTVLLVDVDSTLPNLALMKLSAHHKAQGRPVALQRGLRELPAADTVLASCVFSNAASARRLATLRRHYGPALQLGGSGVDLHLRLPPTVECLPADYSLYMELGDRALGFLTRGCPLRCPFCVVPVKEGLPRQVSDLDTLLQGRRKLILLDDNLLAHPAALPLLEEMARRELAVNFNQTLDLRLLTAEAANLLRRIHCANALFTRRVCHFSLNDTRHLDLTRDRYALLRIEPGDNVEFVCMYGFNTTLAEDVERFRFLRSLRGAYVFVQRYQPVPGGPAPDLSRFFDDRADALMDELVRIVFTQNMKSMETYYRWLAVQYATQRARIHQSLVETLFRYNARPRMSSFLHRLEALCTRSAMPRKASAMPPASCAA